jgi:hypothetical protein
MITPLVSSSSSYSKSGVLFSDNKSDIHDITEISYKVIKFISDLQEASSFFVQ